MWQESTKAMQEFTKILRENPNGAYDFVSENYNEFDKTELVNIIKELLYNVGICVGSSAYSLIYKGIHDYTADSLDEMYKEAYEDLKGE